MSRSERSFMSMHRRHEIVRGSIRSSLPWSRCASISAESRLFAAVIACRSPVKWRFRSSIGTTWVYPPPAAPPLIPNTGPERRLAQREHRLPADLAEALRQRHRGRRLALSRRGRRDRRDVDDLPVRLVGEPLEDREIDLRFVAAVQLELVGLDARLVGDVGDRAKRRFLCDLETREHRPVLSARVHVWAGIYSLSCPVPRYRPGDGAGRGFSLALLVRTDEGRG